MRLRPSVSTFAVALIAVACGNAADDDDSAHGGASTGAGAGGASTAGTTTMGSGGVTGGAGKGTSGGGMPGAGGSSAGLSAVGGSGGSAAGNAGGAAGKSAMDSGAGGMPVAGASGMDTMGAGGMAPGGAGAGGSSGEGAGQGPGGRGMGGRGMGGASAGRSSGGMPGAGGGSAGGGACPASGHVSYTLMKSANPTTDEQAAYDLITPAMDKAIDYYNCYTNITKAESVTYVPSVPTADGNSNGSIRFGGKDYMEYITAMHEIAHTVGVGTYSEWGPLVVNGIFTGDHATTQLRAITGIADDQVHADTQHFWPYGLNYTSEVKSEADVIDHCMMVVAIRLDMGYDP